MHLRLKPINRLFARRAKGRGKAALAVALLAAATAATAQTNQAVFVENDKIHLNIGSSPDLGGELGLSGVITDPFGANTPIFNGDYNRPANLSPRGTRLFLRVDGGYQAGGYDYFFGDIGQAAGSLTGTLTEGGTWTTSPVATGTTLKAVWLTSPVVSTTSSTGTTVAARRYDPQIQISMTATLINDTVRFQFDAKNLSARQHTVQLAFIEDISYIPAFLTGVNPIYNSVLRLPGRPNLKTEALLNGGQIPAYWETYVQDPNQESANPAYFQSSKGAVLPASGAAELTAPIQFAYGDAFALNGSLTAGATPGSAASLSRYANVWSFTTLPSVILAGSAATSQYPGIGLYYGLTTLSPSATTSIITYIGQDTSNNDLAPPMALSVSSIPSLQYLSGAAARYVAGGNVNTFPIVANVFNSSDLTNSYTAGSQNVTLTLTLPKGLKIADSSALTKTITGLNVGAQLAATWLVAPDTSATGGFQAGTQTYSVTATTNATAGSGGASTVAITKTVSRSIEIPAPLNFTLKGTGGTNNKYHLISFPFSSNGASASSVFRLNGLALSLDPNSFNILQYDPARGYTIPTSLTPGQAYWIRVTRTADANISVDPAIYKPLAAQSAPIAYSAGWHLIGNPYVYGIKFSDVTVTNATSGATYTMDQATSSAGLLSSTVYHYDATDANSNNWAYSIEPNNGFTLVPYEGYWIYVNSPVTLTYPFPTAPLGKVTQ